MRGREAIVGAVEQRDAVAPVEVVGLRGVLEALEVERGLVELDGVGVDVVGRRGIGGDALAGVGLVVRGAVGADSRSSRRSC
jgi:hypothetical protein